MPGRALLTWRIAAEDFQGRRVRPRTLSCVRETRRYCTPSRWPRCAGRRVSRCGRLSFEELIKLRSDCVDWNNFGSLRPRKQSPNDSDHRTGVQPGNSGGPLLGENGSVVGVVVGKPAVLLLLAATRR